MNTIAYLTAFVGADVTSFRRGMAQVRSEITATAGMGSSLQALGGALTLGLTVPIAAIGAVSVKAFSDFEAAMRNANSVVGLGEEQFKALSSQVQEFGEDMREGATGAANALNTIFQAGFGLNDTSEALMVMEVAMRTAEAGMADTTITTQALVAALLSYNQGADMAAHYSDILTRTVQVGVGSMTAFASGIGSVLPQAAALGVTFDEVGANLAFLTQRGLSPDEAATAFGGMLRKLMNPTEAMTAALQELGVASGKELIEKFGGLEGALMALGEMFNFNADSMFDLFNEVRAFRGLASIFNNVDTWGDTLKDFNSAIDGATGRAREQQMASFAAFVDRTWSRLQSFFINLGRIVVEIFDPIFKGIGAFVEHLSDLDDQTLKNIVTIGLIVAALPPLIWLLGALMSPVGLLIGAIALLKLAWDENFLGIRDLVQLAIPQIIKFFNDLHLALMGFYVSAGEFIYNVKTIFEQYFSQDLHNLLFGIVVGDWELVKTSLANIWAGIQKLFWDKLATPLGDALAQLGSHNFSQIALGLTAIGAAFAVMGGAILLFKIPTIIGLVTTALIALASTALFPIAVALGVGILLVLAYTNNWLGFKNTIDTQLRPTLDWLWDKLHSINGLLEIFASILSGGAFLPAAGAPSINSNIPNTPVTRPPMGIPPLGDSLLYPPGAGNPGIGVPDLDSWNNAAGYPNLNNNGSTSNMSQNNTIIINSNNPDAILRELRNRGIDLEKPHRG